MTRDEAQAERPDAGAREVRWAPRVPLHEIRRLYHTDALGVVDAERIDDVGSALLARCQSILEVTEAHERGRLRCPRCGAAIQRRGAFANDADDGELLRCGACDWATTARAYRLTYRGKQLHGTNAVPAFAAFVQEFQAAVTSQAKMLAIDRLIHGIHGDLAQGSIGRPAGVGVLEGDARAVVRTLDELAYGEGSTPGLREGQAGWQTTKQEAARRSGYWRSLEGEAPGDGPLAALVARAEEIPMPHGRCRRLVAAVGAAAAPGMRELRAVADELRKALGHPHIIILACLPNDQLHYLALVSEELTERGLRADALVERLAATVGGGGGGSAGAAFGGGGDATRLAAALAEVRRAATPTRRQAPSSSRPGRARPGL